MLWPASRVRDAAGPECERDGHNRVGAAWPRGAAWTKSPSDYIEDFYRNFGYPFADQANGGSIQGMLEAIDLIQKLAGPDTTLVPGHGTLVKKQAYDATTLGDTQRSKDRFITEVDDEVRNFPPVVDGKRTMPRH